MPNYRSLSSAVLPRADDGVVDFREINFLAMKDRLVKTNKVQAGSAKERWSVPAKGNMSAENFGWHATRACHRMCAILVRSACDLRAI